MNNNTKKALSGVAGAAMLLTGCAANVAPVAEEAVVENQYGVAVNEGQAVKFDAVANVQGSFSFDQDTLTPADDLFNIFGTVVTGMCAKPAFETENADPSYYVNVKGKIAKDYSVNLKDKQAEQRVMLCSCATGPATGNVEITGVKLSDVLPLCELGQEVNTITVKGSDGYGLAMPLSYVLEKEAMIVYKINDQAVPSGTQFWVPETVAKYFTRDVVDIELTAEQETPVVDQRDEALRAEVAIMNYADGCAFAVGEDILFEGYADDCGDAITAVEFSLDNGESWSSYATENAGADRWVYWHFGYTPEAAGTYKLAVRAKTASGNVSPLAANVVFTVVDAVGTAL